MNRNNLGSSSSNHVAHNQSQSLASMSSQIYAQSYASRQQSHGVGHSRTSKPRNSEVAKAGTHD